jgi:hypothetical protein
MEKMLCKQNPDTNNWLCFIPDTGIAYYFSKGEAIKFCSAINKALESGKLEVVNGVLKKR